MRRLFILILTFVAFGLCAADLFAKGQNQSSGSHASGTGSKKWNRTPKGQTKKHIITGNYNPNTGRRASRFSKE